MHGHLSQLRFDITLTIWCHDLLYICRWTWLGKICVFLHLVPIYRLKISRAFCFVFLVFVYGSFSSQMRKCISQNNTSVLLSKFNNQLWSAPRQRRQWLHVILSMRSTNQTTCDHVWKRSCITLILEHFCDETSYNNFAFVCLIITCNICNTLEIEDEYHFIYVCHKYCDLTNQLFADIAKLSILILCYLVLSCWTWIYWY